MKFLSPEAAFYLYKSTIQQPCMEYCCHVWAGACSCYLEIIDKQQKQICSSVGRCSSELAQLVPLITRCSKDVYVNSIFRYTARKAGIPCLKNAFL